MNGPQKFRKKPVEVEAWRIPVWSESTSPTGYVDEAVAIGVWCGGNSYLMREDDEHGGPVLEIPTLEGVMQAHEGDYVIKGVQGEFYPCKPDIFEATYEAA